MFELDDPQIFRKNLVRIGSSRKKNSVLINLGIFHSILSYPTVLQSMDVVVVVVVIDNPGQPASQ